MSAFTEANFPGMPQVSGSSVNAMTKLADAYNAAKAVFEAHANKQVGPGNDPHGIKAYIDEIENKAKDTAIVAKRKADNIEALLAGNRTSGLSSAQYLTNELGNDKDVIGVIKTLLDRIAAFETELNTLSLLQFDNVPVGAGIRWYKDTLPADGTYVWANGQTLYGVNQNFPELAEVWELGSSDNVVVPKEDHTIFKVRKATKRVEAIQHAYIDAAAGEDHPSGNDSQQGD